MAPPHAAASRAVACRGAGRPVERREGFPQVIPWLFAVSGARAGALPRRRRSAGGTLGGSSLTTGGRAVGGGTASGSALGLARQGRPRCGARRLALQGRFHGPRDLRPSRGLPLALAGLI